MMKKRPHATCLFCNFFGVLSKEHILPSWMRDHLPDTEVPHLQGTLWRRDRATGTPLAPQTEGRRGSGEYRSQTLRVVCSKCNNGWMSTIVDDGKPAIEPLMLGHWGNLSEEVQRRIATWFALHNMVFERSWNHLQITALADRQKFMEDHDPGSRRFIWIAKIADDAAMPTFARVMGSGEPSASSPTTLVIAIAVGKVALMSIYDPSRIVGEERMQKIEELLNPWGLRIWPTTANAAPPEATLEAEGLNHFLFEIEQIIGGGESRLAQARPEMMKLAMEMVKRQMADGKWPPTVG